MSIDSTDYVERLYRITEKGFKKCGTSIMLINEKGNILYKILPISNDTEARFYHLAYNNIFSNINFILNKQENDKITDSDFDDINFLARNELIPKLYGFYYVKHSILNNDEIWHIVSQYDNQCSIAIGIENIIYGYKDPAVTDIKLGLSYPTTAVYGTDIPKEDILLYINRWRTIKRNLRKSYYNDPIKACKLIRQITPQMVGLPNEYDEYSNDDVYKLLKKWRQIQHSEDSTQSTLGLRICSMYHKLKDNTVIELKSPSIKNIKDDECVEYIKGYFDNGKLSRLYNKIELLMDWISRQNVFFCSTSILAVYDQHDLSTYDIKWIDFNYILPKKDKKPGDCDVNVLKGLKLIKSFCIK